MNNRLGLSAVDTRGTTRSRNLLLLLLLVFATFKGFATLL